MAGGRTMEDIEGAVAAADAAFAAAVSHGLGGHARTQPVLADALRSLLGGCVDVIYRSEDSVVDALLKARATHLLRGFDDARG